MKKTHWRLPDAYRITDNKAVRLVERCLQLWTWFTDSFSRYYRLIVSRTQQGAKRSHKVCTQGETEEAQSHHEMLNVLLPNRDHNQITCVNWNLERSHIWSQADHSIWLWLIIVVVRLTKPLRVMNKASKIAGICKLNIGLIFRLYGPFEASSYKITFG